MLTICVFPEAQTDHLPSLIGLLDFAKSLVILCILDINCHISTGRPFPPICRLSVCLSFAMQMLFSEMQSHLSIFALFLIFSGLHIQVIISVFPLYLPPIQFRLYS